MADLKIIYSTSEITACHLSAFLSFFLSSANLLSIKYSPMVKTSVSNRGFKTVRYNIYKGYPTPGDKTNPRGYSKT